MNRAERRQAQRDARVQEREEARVKRRGALGAPGLVVEGKPVPRGREREFLERVLNGG